ncbi:hypothetical protein CEK28_10560 [Xenophilus sp. AP218F]|nr:hypothetical protein CEK28_10560 [Xenophilus sp. AP218F]
MTLAIPEFSFSSRQLAGSGLLPILDRAVARHGTLTRLRDSEGGELVLLADAGHARYWSSHPESFIKDVDRPSASAAVVRLLLDDALTATRDGEEWRRSRIMTAPLVNHTAPYMTRDNHVCARQLADRLKAGPTLTELSGACDAWAIQLVCRPLMGPGMGEETATAFAHVFRRGFYQILMKAAQAGDCRGLAQDPDFLALRGHMDELTRRLLALTPEPDSMVGRLLAWLGPDADPAEIHRVVRNTVVGNFAASADNTSAALHWSLLHLAQRPDLQQALREEAAALDYRDWDMQRAPLALACVREALRLTPVSPVVERTCVAETELDGYRLAPGQPVLFAPWIVQRSERYWPQPLSYRPERFLERPKPEPGTYFPFGAGKRVCVGMNLALAQLTLAVSLLHRELAIRLDPDSRPVDRQPVFRSNLLPRGEVRFALTPLSARAAMPA